MHHDYRELLVHAGRSELEIATRRAYLERHGSNPALVDESVALRLCRVHDDPALERLAQLDGDCIRSGRYVIAEVDGTIVAAQPLDGTRPIADPFRKTAHVLPLLELRVRQLGGPAAGWTPRLLLSLRRGTARI